MKSLVVNLFRARVSKGLGHGFFQDLWLSAGSLQPNMQIKNLRPSLTEPPHGPGKCPGWTGLEDQPAVACATQASTELSFRAEHKTCAATESARQTLNLNLPLSNALAGGPALRALL